MSHFLLGVILGGITGWGVLAGTSSSRDIPGEILVPSVDLKWTA